MKKVKNTSLNLHDYFGANRKVPRLGPNEAQDNPYYEDALGRKYNHSVRSGTNAVRMVFLNSLLEEQPESSRLVKKGKPLWCYCVKYEGVCKKTSYRQISFTLSIKSKKRFCVGEQHILLIPARVRIYPKFWDGYKQRCSNFGSVFTYSPLMTMMWASSEEFVNGKTRDDFVNRVENDNPYKIGTLVEPRIGLFGPWAKRSSLLKMLEKKYNHLVDTGSPQDQFYTWCREAPEAVIPPGVIISREYGSSKVNYYGKERLKVQMGGEIFEDLHPNELNIILKGEKNEI
jgi:hypothetical protein